MKRDIERHMEEARTILTGHNDLTLDEWRELNKAEKGDAIVDAFLFGVAVGAKAERAKK